MKILYFEERDDLHRKMLKLFINIIIILKFAHGQSLEENRHCTLIDFTMHCKCEKKENLTLTATMHFDIKNIKIEGCANVDVPLGALPHLQLEELAFMNLDELNILPFSLVGLQTLHTLKISNIKKFSVAPHGFVGLMNVQNVLIKNVFSKVVSEASFGGVSVVERFRLENSRFDDVEANSFILTNITSFSIVNCNFKNIDSKSFIIHTAKEVNFNNCHFLNATYNSILLSNVDTLKFDQSVFGVLEAHSIITRNVNVFKFEYCEINNLKSNAFALVDVSEKITFTRNRIKFADVDSLYFANENFTEKGIVLNDCCNYFMCDCSMHWLWEQNETYFHQDLLNKSYCLEDEQTHLADMIPVLDSHGNCKTMEKKILVPTVSSKSPDSNFIMHKVSAVSSSAFMLVSTYSFLASNFFCIGLTNIL